MTGLESVFSATSFSRLSRSSLVATSSHQNPISVSLLYPAADCLSPKVPAEFLRSPSTKDRLGGDGLGEVHLQEIVSRRSWREPRSIFSLALTFEHLSEKKIERSSLTVMMGHFLAPPLRAVISDNTSETSLKRGYQLDHLSQELRPP